MGFFGSTGTWSPPGTDAFQNWAQGWANDPGTNWAQKYLGHLTGDPNSPKWQKAQNQLMNDPRVAAAEMGADSGMRDADRNYQMSTALMGPGQQALRAATQGVMDTRGADQKGQLVANTVGNIYSDLENQSNLINAQNLQKQEFGGQMWNDALNKYKQQYKPGILDRIGQVAGVAGQIMGDVTGLGGLGGVFGGGGGGGYSGADAGGYSGGYGGWGGG